MWTSWISEYEVVVLLIKFQLFKIWWNLRSIWRPDNKVKVESDEILLYSGVKIFLLISFSYCILRFWEKVSSLPISYFANGISTINHVNTQYDILEKTDGALCKLLIKNLDHRFLLKRRNNWLQIVFSKINSLNTFGQNTYFLFFFLGGGG